MFEHLLEENDGIANDFDSDDIDFIKACLLLENFSIERILFIDRNVKNLLLSKFFQTERVSCEGEHMEKEDSGGKQAPWQEDLKAHFTLVRAAL